MLTLSLKRLTALRCLAAAIITLASPVFADTVAYWNFNSLSIGTASNPGTGGVPTTISTNQGSGTLSLAGWGGVVDDFAGSTINVQGSDPAEESLSLVAAASGSAPFAGNGTYIELQLNLADYADPVITFATRGTATGFNTGVWSYSTNGTTFTNIAGNNTASTSTTFALATVNLSSIDALDGAANVKIRYTVSGATSASGNNRIDNLLVSATLASDSTPPVVSSFAPLDNATNIPVTTTPTVTFNENVKKGASGNILVKRSADNTTFETISVTSSQVTVSGASVTIAPSTNLDNSTGYYLEIAAGAIEDIAGNDFAGISGATTWNFTTSAPAVAPTATETFTTQMRVTPTGASATADFYAEGNGQGTFAVYGHGTFNFSKLDFGLSGASTITGITTAEFTLTHNDRTFTQGTEVEFFLTTDSATGKTFNSALVSGVDNSQYSFAPISLGKFPYTPKPGGQKDTFTLDLSSAGAALISRLNTGEDFAIIMAATTPMAAITYSGKNNTFDPGDPELKLTVSETTGVDTTPPTVAFFTPADNSGGLPISSNIKVAFNEIVQKGTSGAITIRRVSDDTIFETIDVTTSQVTVALGTVTIDPVNALESAGSYYVQISSGAIEDVSGNDFAGFIDNGTWNFSTAQPPITATGPFAISQNAPAGTVVGVVNPNINGKEGIKYAILGGSGGSTKMKGEPGTGYMVNPIFTIGDTIENATGALNSSTAGNFSPVGTPDGIGAYSLNATTVRVFMNHEVEVPTTGSGGYPFTLANGTVLNKGGARITYFDIDKASRRVVDGGLAIARMYDRSGNVVTSTSQLELGGLDRMCSASLYEPNLFGTGKGFVDRIYITGEETSTDFGHPHGGTYWALDTTSGDFWALPDVGRGSWENAALVDTGTTTHIALLLGDDAQSTPLYLYVGQKSTAPGANFIERNGLKGGQLYVWKASNGNTSPQQFNGTGSSRAGIWVAINAKNAAAAGTAGHDAQGYKNDSTLHSEADSQGAFSFSRPEDLSTSPTDGSIVAFTSTGRGSLYPLDNWGDTYILDIDFNASAVPTSGFMRIIYSGDDAGNGQFMTPEEGLRCPDNLDWADDGTIYVQEDQSNQVGSFGAAGEETSIWRLTVTGDYSDNNTNTPIIATAVRVAQTDRSTVLPLGSTDGNVGDFGNWESSGIVDVSSLFGKAAGTLFLFDIQAHSVTNGLISAKTLYEGGQLCFLERGAETGAFTINPNTGVITLANPEIVDMAVQPSYELRLQAFDGTNHTLEQVTVNVTNNAVATSNSFKVATFNTSHYRDTANTLINDLAVLTNTASQKIARVIQRNNPDVILLNEFDYDAAGKAIKRFKENYLEVGQSGEAPVYYPYVFITPVNTGVHSGFDLDNNGSVVSTPGATGYGEDAFGFGNHPGQYGLVVLSKFPIDKDNIRTFQKFLWKDMPGALLPDNPNIAGTGDWYSTAELNVFRLSSKTHADVPVLVNGTPVHILASHPTPPVFDSPGSGLPWIAGVDHNGRRNSDEIRFWSDYINPSASSYIYDDTETTATASGGLPANTRFVICGDQNADNNEGDSTDPAIKQLIGGVATVGGATIPANPYVNSTFVPGGGAGTDPDDTAAFSGGVRVDYALPSAFGMTVNSGGVFWPSASSGDPIVAALDATDHHMVYLNLTLTGVETVPNTDLATYYAPGQGLTGAALQTALQSVVDDHSVINYSNLDEIMMVIDEASPGSNQVRLLYSNATLPKTSNNVVGGWNREHVWPRSDGVGDEGPDYSDLHHLFPSKDTVNSLRSNLPFDESANLDSDPFAPESFKDNDSWEPLDRDKGIVARALLYMMVRYDGSDALTSDLLLADNTSPVGTHGVLSTILAWHRAFPPTDYERARNNAIFGGVTISGTQYAQGNRNPFIDFPQFADAIFLDAATQSFAKWQTQNFTLSQLSASSTSSITANPDGDLLDNYGEFLFKGNPNVANNTPLTLAQTGGSVTLTFHRPKGVSEVATLQSSTNQTTWTDVSNWLSSTTITDLGDYQQLAYATDITGVPTPPSWRVIFKQGAATVATSNVVTPTPVSSGVAPAFTTHPANVSIANGASTTLAAVATGTPTPTYQWYIGNSGYTSAPISGATSASFTTPALTTTTSYWVRATNSAGTADSNTAVVTVAPALYTLQILHYYGESGLLGIETAPIMGAMIDKFDGDYANTVVLGEGDSFIPGPWLVAGADPSFNRLLHTGTFTSAADTTATPFAQADIAIMNAFGTTVSALGNHEFDLGSPVLAGAIFPANSSTVGNWAGAQFPIITANLDFAADSSLRGRADTSLGGTGGAIAGLETTAMMGKIAPYAVKTINGQKIGFVGATTFELLSKSSPNGTVPKDDGNAATSDLQEVAVYLQNAVNALQGLGVNKVIMVDQLDDLQRNKDLAGMVSGIDVMVAGGGHERMGDATDTAVPFNGHDANFIADAYPIVTSGADSKPVLIVTTDTEYTYLGRLVVDFDANGELVVSNLSAAVNGAYAANEATLQAVYGSSSSATAIVAGSAMGTAVKNITSAINNIVVAKDSNVYGYTSVYLEGDRVFGRTQEVNLGNITADANAYKARGALSLPETAAVFSLKNGGGLRASLGSVLANGTKVGPLANPITGKPSNAISQLDIENALRFDNKLMVFETTPSGLLTILNFAAGLSSGPSAQSGGYPQVGNIRFSYNSALPAGTKVRTVTLVDEAGNIVAPIVENGVVVAGAPATIQCVTLNFTANGGDSYPIKANAENFRYVLSNGTLSAAVSETLDFTAATTFTAMSLTAADIMGEQKAFQDYLQARHATAGAAYAVADTPVAQDLRIQQLAQNGNVDTVNGAPVISFEVAEVAVNQGSSSVTLNLVRSGGAAATSVLLSTADGTAVSGTDYTGVSNQTVSFAANVNTATATITLGGPAITSSKTFTATIAATGNSTLGAISTVTVRIKADITAPVVKITAPLSNAIVKEPTTATGTVKIEGNLDGGTGTVADPTISTVTVSINGGAAIPAVLSADKKKWSVTFIGASAANAALALGTNSVVATGTDAEGNVGTSNAVSFFYEALRSIVVSTTGTGTVTFLPALAPGSKAAVGRTYTVTAKPAVGFFFDSWSGTAGFSTTSGTTTTFTHAANNTVVANFVSSPFTANNVAGLYNGIVKGSTAATNTQVNAGLFSATVTVNTGAFTGKLQLDGGTSPVAGVFNNVSKTFTSVVASNGLNYSLTLDIPNAKITGTIVTKKRGVDFATLNIDAPLTHTKSTITTGANLAPVPSGSVGVYNVGFSAPTAPAGLLADEYPAGKGYGFLTIKDTDVTSRLVGVLADGTAYTSATYLCRDGTVPVYAPFAAGVGSLVGNLDIDTSAATTDATGTDISWFKKVSGSQYYPFGYDTGLTLSATAAKQSTSTLASLGLSTNPTVTFSAGPFVAPVAKTLASTAAGTYVSTPTTDKSTKVAFTLTGASAGLVTVEYTPSVGALKNLGKGIVVGKGGTSAVHAYILSPLPTHTNGEGQGGAVNIAP